MLPLPIDRTPRKIKITKVLTAIKGLKGQLLLCTRPAEVISPLFSDSLGYSSPRHSKNLEKYKTYIQFITNKTLSLFYF